MGKDKAQATRTLNSIAEKLMPDPYVPAIADMPDLRDRIMMHALPAIIRAWSGRKTMKEIAELAYEQADAAMAVRVKNKPGVPDAEE